ncbi:Hypothetical Protein FCC1311_006612, partial [Hondaea fermentalgiana]
INAYDLFEGYPEMINELDVKLSVSDVFIMLQLLLEVDLVKLMDVRFRSFSTLREIPCLLIPVEKLEPLAFNFNLSAVEIQGGCAGTCDFPLLTYLEDSSPFVNNEENQEEISKLVTDFVDYWTAFVLDMLGKWSFLDVFVIVITLAALRSYVVGAFYANVAFIDDEVFITDVNVTPESGLVLLCFVAALSLVVNHIVMFYHDRVEESNQRSEDRANGNHEIAKRLPRRATVKYPIWKHEFSGSSKSGFTRVVDPIKAKIMMGVVGFAFLLIVIGIWLPLITFELRGLLGLLLEVVSTDSPRLNGEMLNRKTYSVIEMGAALAESPTTNGFEVVSLTFFKILYAIATYIGPIILFIMMTVLFLVPVNLNTGKSLFFWTKIASYWSGLEIFLVAMVLTIMEISIVTQFITDFITNDVCSQIVGALEVLVEEPDLDAFCFNAVGILQPTSVLLFVGVALELTCFYIITVIAHAVLADRYYDAYKGLRSDVKPHRMLRLDRFILTHFTTLKRTAQRPSRGAVDPSAPPELAGGVGPFTDLDNQDDNELIDHEDMWCAPCNRCCANEKGQRTAEARIDAWQSRFAVASNVHRRESGNPAFGASGGPPAARFRSNSIDV